MQVTGIAATAYHRDRKLFEKCIVVSFVSKLNCAIAIIGDRVRGTSDFGERRRLAFFVPARYVG
jgi:hypothetical protein